jgi:hypothetical protein
LRLVLQAVHDNVDVNRMRAIGFCVSIGHAQFMADRFAQTGVPALALTVRPTPTWPVAVWMNSSGSLVRTFFRMIVRFYHPSACSM